MTLLEAMMASLVLMLGTSAGAQLWSHGLRINASVGQREDRLERLEALMLASEGVARDLAEDLPPETDCQSARDQLLPLWRGLDADQRAVLALPPSPAGTLHLRWDLDGSRRERVFSTTVLLRCQEVSHET
jgi:hypothetical protein